ncbi:MAG TPA: restriction endonuclease [Iamia sp.]
MTPGQDLEDLVARFLSEATADDPHATVERDVHLPGPEGSRQIDVLMRTSSGPFNLLTIVECKDYARNVTVAAVDALDSVARDVKASKAVLVSRKGFSKGARQKAARLGIELMRADSVSSIGEVAFDIPIHVTEYTADDIRSSFSCVIYGGPDAPVLLSHTNSQIWEAGIPEMIRQEVRRLAQAETMHAGLMHFTRQDLDPPITIRNGRGDEAPIDGLTIRFAITERHFRGSLSDLGTATYLHDVAAGSTTTILDAEQVTLDYRQVFAEFTTGPEPGTEAQLDLTVTRLPDLDVVNAMPGTFRFEPVGDESAWPSGRPTPFEVPFTFRRDQD